MDDLSLSSSSSSSSRNNPDNYQDKFKFKFKILFWVIYIFSSISLIAQDTTFINLKKIDSIEITAEYFTTDPMQNIYVLNSEGIIQKYNVNGDLLFEYSNENFGKPTFIDATNPLRVLLFYSEYLTAIVLDRTLNELYIHNLIDYGINQVTAITTAPDNGLWLYDEWTYQIKKINPSGEVEVTSNDLSQAVNSKFAENFIPDQIIFKSNQIYLFDISTIGLLVFDFYGNIIQQYSKIGNEPIQVSEKYIIYSSEDELYFKPLHLADDEEIIELVHLPLKKEKGDKVRVEGNVLFFKTSDKISIYK